MLRETRKGRPLPGGGNHQERERRHRRGVRQPEDDQQDERGKDQGGDDALAQHQRVSTCCGTSPKRRWRWPKCPIAASSSRSPKSGHNVSQKYSSVYARFHSKKLLMR